MIRVKIAWEAGYGGGDNAAFLLQHPEVKIASHSSNHKKGQTDAALPNKNLMFGLPETTGLNRPGIYP